jgi:hypothetical protein
VWRPLVGAVARLLASTMSGMRLKRTRSRGEESGAMSEKEDAPRALLEIVSEAQRIIAELPEGLKGAVDLRARHVYMEIQGRDSPAFEVVLGSEAPEIVYDEQFIQYKLIGGELEDQFEFARTTANQIVEFLLSGRKAALRKSRIFRRTYLCVPLSDGTEWRMKKFSAN